MSTSTFSFSQISKVHDTLAEKGVTGDILQKELLEKGRLSDMSEAAIYGTIPDREAFRKFLNLSPLSGHFVFTIDNGKEDKSQMLEKMVATGKRAWNIDVVRVKRTKKIGAGQIEFQAKLIKFYNEKITLKEALRLIKVFDVNNPWEPGKIEHLLSFAQEYPDEQRKYPIIGLGSVVECGGQICVPFLGLGYDGRCLSLDFKQSGWNSTHRFLVVRKKVLCTQS
jgi:hypothetical protein